MSEREYHDYLNDILDSITDIINFTYDLDFEDFKKDRKTINAVIRCLEIIGEAAKKVPKHIKEKNPEIPWKEMCAMRDKLIHEYHGVDLAIVWAVIIEDIPPLKKKFESIIHENIH